MLETAARVLARMVRACRSPPPQRCARGVYTRAVPAVAIAASERWNAALGAGLASFGAGGFVAAVGIGTAECAGRDDDDAASDADMDTPTRWATNPLAEACRVPFSASASGGKHATISTEELRCVPRPHTSLRRSHVMLYC